MEEQWKPIKGYKGWYEVSNLGRVRRIKPTHGTRAGRIATQHTNRTGYASVCLSKNNVSRTWHTHRLVTRAFLGVCPLGMEVNHKDSNKLNPCLSNLEYVTRSENERHANANGKYQCKGEDKPQHKLTANDVRQILSSQGTNRAVAMQYGVTHRTIWAIRNRKKWRHIIPEVL